MGVALRTPGPNPFDGVTALEFTLPVAGRVSVAVYDAAGRSVRPLAAGVFPPGTHRVEWDGRDAAGRRAASGLYFVRLETATGVMVRKLVLARGAGPR